MSKPIKEAPRTDVIGTSYFVSRRSAWQYYRAQGESPDVVQSKLDAGEIHIGTPPLAEGERLKVIDGYLRYGIERQH